jgi:release factor glutamine methyltransferase
MIPTPSTSHVSFDTIYEPAEDSFLLLDTISSEEESAWLCRRFSKETDQSPLFIVEAGTGSGVVLAFAAANPEEIFGRPDVLTLGTDVNLDACKATRQTVLRAVDDKRMGYPGEDGFISRLDLMPGVDPRESGSVLEVENAETGKETHFLASMTADLCAPLRARNVDVLFFNPPYVPTPDMPPLPLPSTADESSSMSKWEKFERDSYLLSLTYAGGLDGMETTNRLLDAIPEVLNPWRGVAYVLLCGQNKPEMVKERICDWGDGWTAEILGANKMQAGWERLVVLRICRDGPDGAASPSTVTEG